ncbi:MAG: murein biosynthesis integral membrane protein MurJ, partial [Candidatus Doudnabacteria bacterium]|nr:murein biosynthesis integral membrane protein MurJ [Candidatus Doudnabacteria bacterium]
MTNPEQKENYRVQKATLIIAVFAVLAKIVGLVRDAVFSNMFGTGEVMDAYFAAFRLPDFIFNLLVLGTFSVAFIPIFSEYLIKDKKQAYQVASGILNITLLMIGALTVLAYLFLDPLVSLIAPGLEGQTRELTRTFTQIFLLSPIFLTLSSIVSSILNTEKKFALVSAAPVVYNLSIILGAVVFYPSMGPKGLAWGVVIGAFLHLIIQLPGLNRLGFKYSIVLALKDPGVRKFWKLYWPRIFSMGTSQVTLLIATFFGSFLGTGALASFYYANNLQSVFLSIFAVSFAIAVFPMLSELFNKKDSEGFKDVLAKTTVQILYFIIPLSTLMLVLRAQIVRLVLGIGAGTNFGFDDTRLVSLNLGLFVISLFAQALIPLYSRAFYARHNTMTPMVVGLIVIVVNIITTYYAVGAFGIPGMVLAFSATTILHLIIILMELHHRIGSMRDEYLVINTLKIAIASLCGGIISYVVLYVVAPLVNMQTYWGILIQGTSSAIIGFAVYLISAWLLRVDESHHIIRLLKSAFKKKKKE